jgi:hypothetical protein
VKHSVSRTKRRRVNHEHHSNHHPRCDQGEVAFLVGKERYDAKAGSFVYGPRDVQHTFMVTSPEARFLLVCEPTGFEDFVKEAGVPAESLTIPGPEVPVPDPERLTEIAAKYGMDILGPPGIPG